MKKLDKSETDKTHLLINYSENGSDIGDDNFHGDQSDQENSSNEEEKLRKQTIDEHEFFGYSQKESLGPHVDENKTIMRASLRYRSKLDRGKSEARRKSK